MPLALRPEVRDEKVGAAQRTGIEARQRIVGPQNFESFFVHVAFLSEAVIADFARKGDERGSQGRRFPVGSAVKKDRLPDQHKGEEAKVIIAQQLFHAVFPATFETRIRNW